MNPLKPSQRNHAITRLEVVIVLCVLSVIAFVVFSALSAAKRYSTILNCASNLKQVGLAFRIWEGDHNDRYPALIFTNTFGEPQFANLFQYYQVMSNELNSAKILICPADKTHTAIPSYTAADNFTTDFNDTHISYFMSLTADETQPKNFLCGDYNFENGQPLNHGIMNLTTNDAVRWTHQVHKDYGNIALADGSVVEPANSELQAALKQTTLTTNRLIFPQ